MGSTQYQLVDRVILQRDDVIFEAGTERGEGSTAYLRTAAEFARCTFVTCDPNVEMSRYGAVTMRAQDLLHEFDQHVSGKIRFAYVDAADWPYSWHLNDPHLMSNVNSLYAQWGGELSEEHSSAEHLQIAVKLHPWMHEHSTIVIDDTWLTPDHLWRGKGAFAVPYLVELGWRLRQTVCADEPADGYAWLER